MDLKNSERILRQGARTGEAGQFTQACLAILWEAVSSQGGVVLQTEGDALIALFPLESCPEPARAALAERLRVSSPPGGRWAFHARTLVGKHSRRYEVSAYRPCDPDRLRALAA